MTKLFTISSIFVFLVSVNAMAVNFQNTDAIHKGLEQVFGKSLDNLPVLAGMEINGSLTLRILDESRICQAVAPIGTTNIYDGDSTDYLSLNASEREHSVEVYVIAHRSTWSRSQQTVWIRDDFSNASLSPLSDSNPSKLVASIPDTEKDHEVVLLRTSVFVNKAVHPIYLFSLNCRSN